MRLALSYARGFDARIVQHPEDPSLAAGGAATESEQATRLGLPGIPAAAEALMVARDIRLAELTGGAVHFAHVSTAEALGLIRQAKAAGLRVTCDTAPPYFDLNETSIGDFRSYAKLSPPLRKEADRRAVVAGLVDGTVDAVASDHQPRDADDKRLPFALASAGGSGLATLLAVTLAQVHNGSLALAAAIDLLTAQTGSAAGHRRRDGSPAARPPICACSSRTGSGRWMPAGCRARRRTRRSTAGRWKASCSGPGSAEPGCSGNPVTIRGMLKAVCAGIMMTALAGCAARPRQSCTPGFGSPVLVVNLFFGEAIRGRGDLTDREWLQFLDDTVAVSLPDGFTVFDAAGGWMDPVTHRT